MERVDSVSAARAVPSLTADLANKTSEEKYEDIQNKNISDQDEKAEWRSARAYGHTG